jgi:hypothetical protein
VGTQPTQARRWSAGEVLTRFLLDTTTVSAAMWKSPDPGVLVSVTQLVVRQQRRPHHRQRVVVMSYAHPH